MTRNTDSVLEVTLTGEDELPLTISGIEDIEIIIYQFPKRIVQRFKKSEGNIITTDDTGGIVEVYIDRLNTMSLNDKKECKLEVICYFSDVNFQGDLRREVDTDIELQMVDDSPTAREY